MKIGILGAGNIAGTMANTIRQMKTAELYAVASRTIDKAQKFAEDYHVTKAYGSYLELVCDPEVGLVYIATPHSHHYEHMKLCIEYGKPVLCEKAFTRNAAEAAEIFALAKEKNIFITEAIWTRYMPIRKTIKDVMNSGIIGEIHSLQANLGYPVAHKERLKSPSLAGGALLDIGVYPLNFALMIFDGKVKEIQSSAILTEQGVDACESITLIYEDGKMAVLHGSMVTATDRKGYIYGSNGYMEIENINNFERIKVFNMKHQLMEEYQAQEKISGYEYEVQASIDALQAGKTECEEMPHQETLYVMKLMDGMRKEWGVVYPGENSEK